MFAWVRTATPRQYSRPVPPPQIRDSHFCRVRGPMVPNASESTKIYMRLYCTGLSCIDGLFVVCPWNSPARLSRAAATRIRLPLLAGQVLLISVTPATVLARNVYVYLLTLQIAISAHGEADSHLTRVHAWPDCTCHTAVNETRREKQCIDSHTKKTQIGK